MWDVSELPRLYRDLAAAWVKYRRLALEHRLTSPAMLE
jgi:hypothetical protein